MSFTTIYVAASSKQLWRAKQAMAALRERGYTISHDWVLDVETVGSANPPDASDTDRETWAYADLKGVRTADAVWVLMPAENPSFGAGVEFGVALGCGIPIIASGCNNTSIFTSLAVCYDRDDQALDTEFPELDLRGEPFGVVPF